MIALLFVVAQMDANLTTAEGKTVRLSAYRGKPTILFYEDRSAGELNKPLKDRLFKEGKERGMLEDVNILAVAALKSYNFFPAKQFALEAIRSLQKKYGVTIHVDFEGKVGLPQQGSTVVLLDPDGRVLYQHTGYFDEARTQKLLDLVVADDT